MFVMRILGEWGGIFCVGNACRSARLVDVAAFYAAFDFAIDLCRTALSGLGGAGVEEQEGGGEEDEFFHAGFLWLDGRGGCLKLNKRVSDDLFYQCDAILSRWMSSSSWA